MTPYDVFKEIEQGESVEGLRVKEVQLWPIIRFKFFEALRAKEGSMSSRIISVNSGVIKPLIRSLLYGVTHLLRLRKMENWIFSSSDRRKQINGLYADRVVEGIPQLLPKSIVFENPLPLQRHYPKALLPHQQVASQSFFYLGSFLFSLFFKNVKIENEALLRRLLREHGIQLDYRSMFATFMGQYYFTSFVLAFCKVKMVFMVYTASSMGYIKAFKRKKIPVVELQHGVINSKHIAYNVFKKFDSTFFPDYLFSYGSTELAHFYNKNYFLDRDKVFPVGYYFLEKIAQLPNIETSYACDLRASYQRIVVFSFQEPLANLSLPFLHDAALARPDTIYLIVPRNPDYPFDEGAFPENMKIERRLNIYEAMKLGDIHVTVNSTTALEAFYFGKPNILIDINHMASDYYYGLFKGLKSVEIVADLDEFLQAIHKFDQVNATEVKMEGSQFFVDGWEQNFQRAVISIYESKNLRD